MNTILEKIVNHQKKLVHIKKNLMPESVLKSFPQFKVESKSLKSSVLNSEFGMIAEFKRRSPSQTAIHLDADITEIPDKYKKLNAAAMSVLTNQRFFGGSLEDLQIAKSISDLPVLRKDFIVDAYQVFESKAYGADAILLIANMLQNNELETFASIAKDLGLEILFEIHELDEIQKLSTDKIDLIGINNRNLKTFEVDFNHSLKLLNALPENLPKISESGIKSQKTIENLIQQGFDGVLVGEMLMKNNLQETKSQF
ncbi:MAG: indole-3-glycerol phosphate synthase TrpC [Psychroflexus sp.]